MKPYAIELIKGDHPGLWTAAFEVCAVARCREGGAPPWPLEAHCRNLPTAGTGERAVLLSWGQRSERDADRAERAFDEATLTEMAAIGVCAASLAVLREGNITEVTQRGSRVDYWLDDQRAILEVSGIWRGETSDIEARHREKARQLRASGLFRQGKPGYVFVVLFEGRVAHISHLRP